MQVYFLIQVIVIILHYDDGEFALWIYCYHQQTLLDGEQKLSQKRVNIGFGQPETKLKHNSK